MSWIEVGIAVAAAVVMFLFGIEHFSSEIQAITGQRFRRFIATGTNNRFLGFALGAAVTAVIQSSTATSVITVGLVNAGVLSFRQSLGVLFGANVGTTVTAQLVALELTAFAPYLILGGFIAGMLPIKFRVFGRSIFYFGLVFFSLELVSNAVEPLKADPAMLSMMSNLDQPLIGVAVGALFTTLVQSSSVTTGVAIVLMSQGALTLPAAIPMILGANIGTTTTSLIAATRLDTSAKRTAVSHALYNVLGAVLFLPFLPYFAPLLERAGLGGAPALAAAHLGFNVITAGVFLAVLEPFARLVERLVPDDAAEETPIVGLNRDDFEEPALADAAVLRWAGSVVHTQGLSYTAAVLALETRDHTIDARARRTSAMVDYALEEASVAVRDVGVGEVSHEISEAILRFVVTIDHLRQIQDSLADLMAISERLESQHDRLSLDVILEVQSVYPAFAKNLELLSKMLTQPAKPEERIEALAQAQHHCQDRVQSSYRQFLVLVRELDDASELADFLSIHQRLRTKLAAFVGHLHGEGTIAAPSPLQPWPGLPEPAPGT